MVEKEKMTNKYNIDVSVKIPLYLDEEIIDMIKHIADEYGVTPTEVVRSALKSEDIFNRTIRR
jgi:antitoxin component of RelBE/YafQ-DinJ toxin-antitoxin module